MNIAVCGSMQHTEKQLALRDALIALGHQASTSRFAEGMVGKSDDEKEAMKLQQKYEQDAIREYWGVIQECDAILVANYDKNSIKNYIGGNTFLEMGFAHVMDKPIFLINPIPEMPFYQTEIIAMKPVVIDGDLTRIK